MLKRVPNARRNSILLRRWEWIVGALITLAAVHLHVVYQWHAGGLWRDEISSVQIASQPTFLEMWQLLKHESFPALLHIVIRAWAAIGPDSSDFHLRWLGFLFGLALLASFWCAAWLMRPGVPVVSLALLALNVTVIRWGDSLRGYGLGSALVILALALMWRFVRKPTPGNGLVTVFAAVLSVQCLYQNAFFVLAACCGGCAVCALERQWRKALWIVGIGAVAAISLVPYIPTMIQTRETMAIVRVGFQPAWIWQRASTAMGSPVAWFNAVWMLLVAVAIGAALAMMRRDAKVSPVPAHRVLALYAVVAMVVGLVCFTFYLKLASLRTESWYYIPLMVFVAVCLDVILPGCHRWARAVLAIFAALTSLAAYPLGLPAMNYRLTNVDLVAARLSKEAAPNDFIIVQEYFCGSTFYRYYKGNTPWTTLPPLEDYRLQRIDVVKVKMQMENPIQPVLDKVASTLQSGNRVWLVGPIPLNDSPPPELRPAPNNPWGWYSAPYFGIWAAQLGYFIVIHAGQGAVIVEPSTNCNPYENLPVVLITGWRSSPLPAKTQ